MIRTGTFRYARYADLPALLRAGWMITADLGPVHRAYACLVWRCDCPEDGHSAPVAGSALMQRTSTLSATPSGSGGSLRQ